MNIVRTVLFSVFDRFVDGTIMMGTLKYGWTPSFQDSWSRRLGRCVLRFGPMVSLVSGLLARPGIDLFRVFGLENKGRCGLF